MSCSVIYRISKKKKLKKITITCSFVNEINCWLLTNVLNKNYCGYIGYNLACFVHIRNAWNLTGIFEKKIWLLDALAQFAFTKSGTKCGTIYPFNDQCPSHIETSPLISYANQLVGFCMRGTLIVKGLRRRI